MWSGRQPFAGWRLWWGLGRRLASWSRVLQEFPSPNQDLRRRKEKNFSLVTPPGIAVRNSLPASAKSRIQSVQGNPEKQPGARRGGGGDEWPPRAAGSPRRRSATLGAQMLPRRAASLGRARPPPPRRRRPQSRAGRLLSLAPAAPFAGVAAASPSGTGSRGAGKARRQPPPPAARLPARPSVPAFPSRPRVLSRLPAAVPPRTAQEVGAGGEPVSSGARGAAAGAEASHRAAGPPSRARETARGGEEGAD